MTTFSDATAHWTDAGPFSFERRQMDRWPAHGAATGFCLTGDLFGQMFDLSLVDHSHDGMGATCAAPITPGVELSIGFSAPGYVARRGRVLRCMPCGEGYRVAIQFQGRMAA